MSKIVVTGELTSATNSRIGRRYYKFYDEIHEVDLSNKEFLDAKEKEKNTSDYFISEVHNDGSETVLYKK